MNLVSSNLFTVATFFISWVGYIDETGTAIPPLKLLLPRVGVCVCAGGEYIGICCTG